jgi:lipopolysaccharide transport system ATP-binding protein
MSETAITVENISKCYRIGVRENLSDTFFGEVINFIKSPYRNYQKLRNLSNFRDIGNNDKDILWALKNISFEVNKGDVFGIVGKNGAGKSTMLKILSRIVEPTSGQALIKGKVSSLLEVGTGFHQELTGRENIYLNGTILGMSKSEINRKFDEIVDFSEIEKFIDTPVKRYSSGMAVRLAFSVAAHLNPDILIIDEVLAVGDIRFQEKCLNKIEAVNSSENRTVIFVSHNINMVRNICKNVIVLDDGLVKYNGGVNEGVKYYLNRNDQYENSDIVINRKMIGPSTGFQIVDVKVLDQNCNVINTISTGDSIKVRIFFELDENINNLGFDIFISNDQYLEISKFSTYPLSGYKIEPQSAGTGLIDFNIPSLPLVPGVYYFSIHLVRPLQTIMHKLENVIKIRVSPGDIHKSGYPPDSGLLTFNHEWLISRN